ncbi:MAG: O-antigen ligase family protein [bacterium]|nr:O-antigen ligase family protein [bacterium]MDO8742377.1 O-antigen ligase family protein [bacterium]
MENTTTKQIALWTALGALFLIPLTPLIVANGYFFPFISGKAFFFRILVEIAVVAWAVLAALDAAYRPRFSWISAAAIGFVAWMFIADVSAINSAKAFWSNFERMEGWVLLIHLLGFFFASSAVLGVEKKWRAWFLISLGVSAIISVHALLQLGGSAQIHQGSTRIDASLGNSAYLAIYFLFNVFIALWVALTEKRMWLSYSLIVLAVIEGVLIFFTETRGTIIGFTLALALATLLTVITAGKRLRTVAAAAFILILASASGLYLARNSDFVRNNHVLERVTSISLSDGQTRFIIWSMALKGVSERPMLGWGQEGFNYIFNKYYEPSLYGQEVWFDRAHNAFIDWLTAGGVPAFLLYLSLFGSALVLLWTRSELSRPERIALTAAFVGYAVHNLFVFDNLYSYVYFFALLSLVHSQVARPVKQFEEMSELSSEDGVTYAFPIAAVVVGVLIWYVNISGMIVSTTLISAMTPSNLGIKENIRIFGELAAHPSFAAQEIREQIISLAASVVQSQQATNEEKQAAVSLAITEMQRQVAAYPLDARERLQLAYAYRLTGNSAEALKEIGEALKLSPGKVQILIEEGMILWDQGDMLGAQKAFSAAYNLAPQFTDLAAYAAVGHIIAGDLKAADAVLVSAYGSVNADSDVLALAFYRTKNWARLVGIWKLRAEKPGASVESWFSLAAAYYMAGDKVGAIRTINHAVELYPAAAANAAAAIEQIKAGTVTQ